MSPKAVAAHLKYVDRRGELDIETDDGEQMKGKGVEQSLVEDWDLDIDVAESELPYAGSPGRKASKLVHNVILSMPASTPPDRLLRASRAFAREQFALKHRYAMVLHTDQDHPHVHLVIKAMSERGERLNIRKATLRGWRQEFARHLRDQGIEANATERAVRGESRNHKPDGIFRAAYRGASTHMRDRTEAVATELRSGELRSESARSTLIATRRDVERGWRAVSHSLASSGYSEVASHVDQFIAQMPPVRTEKEWIVDQLRAHAGKSVRAPVR